MFIEGRTYVTPDDVKYILQPVDLHRLQLTGEGILTAKPTEVLSEIVDAIPMPVEAMMILLLLNMAIVLIL